MPGGAPHGLWLEALALRGAIPLLLRALPLDRVLATLSLPARARPATRLAAPRLQALERVTDRLTRELGLTRTACLKRALLRYALLHREGARPRFVIGVRPGRGPDGFEAHAWVCVNGAPVMEREPPRYRESFVWPPEGPRAAQSRASSAPAAA